MFKLFILLLAPALVAGKRQIPIGGIFSGDNEEVELSFRYAITRVNMNERNFELVPIIKFVSPTDSFKTESVVCELAAEGVAGIFGPSSIISEGITGSICNAMEIPHIIYHWSPQPLGAARERRHYMTINVYPDSDTLARAMADIIVDYTWKSYTIIYETDEGLIRLKDILQIHGPQDSPITVRQLDGGPDYRPLFKEIQASGENHIILDVSTDKILDILRQAKEVKMLEDYQRYILTSLDAHTIDFEELKFQRTNITAVRLMDTKSFELKTAVYDWEQGERNLNRMFRVSAEHVQTESALVNDAVKLFATALRELDATEEINPSKSSCKHPTPWTDGLRIVNYMKIKTDHGITGDLVFNDDGKRTHFNLEVIELGKEGFKKIATWTPSGGVDYTRTSSEVESEIMESLQNKTFIVTSRIGEPFLMERIPKDGEYFEGNARYEGYSLDLIDGISKILGFKYIFELVPDKAYGSYNKETKQWNGLIRQLLDRKADLAICDLTITYERRTAVDFTMPFMTLGISILFSKPVKEDPDLFSFLSPLSLEVWLYMATAYMGVSLLLFILARMAPDDWENPHPCNQEPEEKENIWNMLNCTWLTMGSIMGQGCDLLPKAISTRLVAGMWWFFALIMLASYTANLAAFLTMERMDASIESAEDLAKQSKIKYGAVKGGSTLGFFKNSNFSTYQRMWAAMESTRPSVFTSNNKEGVDRVSKSKRTYAFLMESTAIEYNAQRNCNLTQIGGLLDSKGYGIAMPVNSPYRTLVSGAVLKMQEEGKLYQLKNKWWKEMYVEGSCDTEESGGSDSAAELGIGNVGGVFLVLGIGIFCSYCIAIVEFLWNAKSVAVEEKVTYTEALIAELKFALDVRTTTKPVHNCQTDTTSGGSSKSSKSSRRSSRSNSESKSFSTHLKHATSSALNINKIGFLFNKDKANGNGNVDKK